MSKVVRECRAGDFSPDDAPPSGRWVEADSNQSEVLVENNQRHTTQERANILRMPKAIKLLVKMRNMSFISRKKLNRLFGQPNTMSSKFTVLWPMSEFLAFLR